MPSSAADATSTMGSLMTAAPAPYTVANLRAAYAAALMASILYGVPASSAPGARQALTRSRRVPPHMRGDLPANLPPPAAAGAAPQHPAALHHALHPRHARGHHGLVHHERVLWFAPPRRRAAAPVVDGNGGAAGDVHPGADRERGLQELADPRRRRTAGMSIVRESVFRANFLCSFGEHSLCGTRTG
jgi:hypothetical protein